MSSDSCSSMSSDSCSSMPSGSCSSMTYDTYFWLRIHYTWVSSIFWTHVLLCLLARVLQYILKCVLLCLLTHAFLSFLTWILYVFSGTRCMLIDMCSSLLSSTCSMLFDMCSSLLSVTCSSNGFQPTMFFCTSFS